MFLACELLPANLPILIAQTPGDVNLKKFGALQVVFLFEKQENVLIRAVTCGQRQR
jgi:hypothetical protein